MTYYRVTYQGITYQIDTPINLHGDDYYYYYDYGFTAQVYGLEGTYDKSVCTLTDYINSLRARCAANMLLTEDLSMTEIAMRSGFESLRTFYRVFKSNYNCTPSVYKKKKLNE